MRALKSTPLYKQVKASILSRMAEGEWAPGTFLPCETDLAKEYQVSHGTLRRALDSLTREHKLTRYQGKGTAVALLDSDQALFKFFQIHREDGVCPLPTSMNIRVTRGSGERDGATAKEADALNMEVGDDVIRIRRIRIVDNLPLFNEYITVPHRLFQGLEDESLESIPNTLYDYFQRKYNVTISRARELVSAVEASAEDARRLSIEAGKPILRVERVAYDITDRPVEHRITHMLTQGYYYYAELGG
ncbi:HTH-type transcriptional repressor YvoA [Pseudodesulfovibrio hydrargyri]|uniref:HTH-type transcriptional repressor YvoA n=1 Tax=Pseudodesulfovibrio hydrargyri TaxID=2125990 RepID=A0A1J5NBV7_9BACT|nr:GntR family transcriptional regulator [Pseudodesulfovibrio hydrargyri]OIQ50703.1 HTH-type transcriptional repressor YvoA [Pseudodesulfovibrio hydrargyri]